MQGWTGLACDRALCVRFNCSSAYGTCSLPDVCTCRDGYSGRDCASACTCVHGSCSDGSSGSGVCACAPGFFGPSCASACTCLHGVCNDGAQGSGTCTSCDPGWLGTNCNLSTATVAVPAALGGVLLLLLLVVLVRRAIAVARHRALLSNMDWKVRLSWVSFFLPLIFPFHPAHPSSTTASCRWSRRGRVAWRLRASRRACASTQRGLWRVGRPVLRRRGESRGWVG